MYLKINIKKILGLLVIILGLSFSVVAQKIVLSEVKLSSQEQIKLNQGKVILKGKHGKYVGQVLATGDLDPAWNVLTDYNNFKKFLPNVVASRIVEAHGDRKIFEQVNQVDLLFIQEQYTVQIAATENKPQKIDFKIFKGDLKQLQGTWQLQQVSSGKVLVTHSVIVEPEAKTEKAFFYGIYESCLEDTLRAISTEITKRSK